jgi:hypothetical protein
MNWNKYFTQIETWYTGHKPANTHYITGVELKFIQFSQWNHVIDAPPSNMDAFLSTDTSDPLT